MKQRKREPKHALEALLKRIDERAFLVRHLLVDVVLPKGENGDEVCAMRLDVCQRAG
jgi:hypothetical protein